MLKAFFSSATGMRAQEVLIDVTANNLANVNTNGYKRHHVNFADLLYTNGRSAGSQVTDTQTTPVPLQLGSGVRVLGTTKSFQAGILEETGVRTDMAIEGEGFFRIQMPDGTFAYTRDGAFRMQGDGTLVNGDGFLLADNIQIPENALESLSIGEDGTVSAVINGQTQNIGQISLVQFRNPAGLKNEGGNLFSETPASGAPQEGIARTTPGFGRIRQQFLERSNVEIVRELVSLIAAQRAYEINSRSIRAGDEMLSNTAQIIR